MTRQIHSKPAGARRRTRQTPPARKQATAPAVSFGEQLRQDLRLPPDWEIELEVELDQPADDIEYDLSEVGGIEGVARIVAKAMADCLAKARRR